MKRTEKSFVLILLFMLIGIVLTRFLVLTHEMDHHPDEIYFYDAASSLKDHFLHGTEYQELKEYLREPMFFKCPFIYYQNAFPVFKMLNFGDALQVYFTSALLV